MTLTATCHCGATKFEVPRAPEDATECNCTFCLKTGGLWAYYKPEELRILSETDAGIYAPRGINKHHFCTKYGCSTYGVTPDWSLADVGSNIIPHTTKVGINIRLLDNFDMQNVPIHKIDGRHLW